MEPNEEMREQIFETIDNQIRENTPPETKKTFDRLRKQGFDDFTTRQMIGQCLAVEIFNAIKHGEAYDEERYVNHLKALPKEPFD